MNQILEIPLTDIIRDNDQPRKHFDQKELKELAASINKYGLLQPIIVRKDLETPKYVIIAGERRYRSSLMAGLASIKALVREEEDRIEIALIENLQRKDLNKIEEANAIRRIMDEKKYTQEQVAEILSKSRPYIANSLRLLNLNSHMQKALIEERISDAHARVLVGIKEEKEKQRLLEKIIRERLSVREAEKYSKNLKNKKDIFLANAIERLEESLSTRVYTKGSEKSGTLCINYQTSSELQEIIEKMLNTFN
ncbi:MAG: ParB/RepB/Spo0J family partition protein [Proteocatella sp.]